RAWDGPSGPGWPAERSLGGGQAPALQPRGRVAFPQGAGAPWPDRCPLVPLSHTGRGARGEGSHGGVEWGCVWPGRGRRGEGCPFSASPRRSRVGQGRVFGGRRWPGRAHCRSLRLALVPCLALVPRLALVVLAHTRAVEDRCRVPEHVEDRA